MRRFPKRPQPGPVRPEPTEPGAPELVDAAPAPVAAGAFGSLADLPVAGLTRRRIAVLIGALVAAWVIVLFARQVGEASEATARADAMRAHNVQLQEDVAGLEHELQLIQRQSYIAQAARSYRLGNAAEVPVTLAEDAPALSPDAPGSAATRLGTASDQERPVDAWARLLFGDAGD
jgi:membrane protein implicated in regulation of membrane protease activity